jgi:hypothetical protein
LQVKLTDPQTKPGQRHIGYYASEEDAARAYDCAAVQAHGPGAKRNFPDEAISELPVSLGEERKQRTSSRYMGVSWYKAQSSWAVSLTDPQTKRRRSVGYFASEEDAARAYDCAAVRESGTDARRNFPGEAISEMPAMICQQARGPGAERKSTGKVVSEPVGKHKQASGPGAKRKSAGKAISNPPAAKRQQASGPGAKRKASSEAPASKRQQVHRLAAKRRAISKASSEPLTKKRARRSHT